MKRTRHRFQVALSVWRLNRAAAAAFHNPILDGGILAFPPSIFRKPRLKFLVIGLAASVLGLATLIGSDIHGRHALPSIPEASLLAETAATPSPQPSPDGPGSPSMSALLAPPAARRPIVFPGNSAVLIACKRERTMYVYLREGKGWKKTAAYPMAFGRKPGDKTESGDLRTPEGRYWIIGMHPGAAKGPLYGSLVFTLNYPDPADEAEGKSGQGIWIHGVEAGRLPNFTHGCLSLSNEDMVSLAAYADIGIPVLILPDSSLPNPSRQLDLVGMQREYPAVMAAHGRATHADSSEHARILADAREFVAKEAKDFPELDMQMPSPADHKRILARLQKWREDWSSRDLDAYAANYDPDFRDAGGQDKAAFLSRKGRIFASKTKISMEVGEPQIEPEGYARVKVSFRQDYLAESPQGVQRSSGSKTLRLEDGPTGWLIIGE